MILKTLYQNLLLTAAFYRTKLFLPNFSGGAILKKIKILSIVVIMLSVIALGVFMGKQMFKLMEAGSSGNSTQADGGNATSSVTILYSTDKSNPGQQSPEPVTVVNAAETASPTASANTSATTASETAKADGTGFDPKGPKWFAFASGNGTNVRMGPSTDEKLFFKVGKGTRGVVQDKKNGWTCIKWDFNRKTGWVRDDLLIQGPAAVMQSLVQKPEDLEKIDAKKISNANAKEIMRESKLAVAIARPAPASETVNTYVKGKSLPETGTIEATTFANIRSNPSTTSDKVAKLPKGAVVKIKSVQQEGRWQWFEIIFNEGKKTGWTREDNLKF